MFTWPPPSPPFHQISLPLAPPLLVRKLQTVRFSMETPFAVPVWPNTSMPLRPCPAGPSSWLATAPEQAGEPGLVPSTITAFRSMPRR